MVSKNDCLDSESAENIGYATWLSREVIEGLFQIYIPEDKWVSLFNRYQLDKYNKSNYRKLLESRPFEDLILEFMMVQGLVKPDTEGRINRKFIAERIKIFFFTQKFVRFDYGSINKNNIRVPSRNPDEENRLGSDEYLETKASLGSNAFIDSEQLVRVEIKDFRTRYYLKDGNYRKKPLFLWSDFFS